MKFPTKLFAFLFFLVSASLMFTSCKEDELKPSPQVMEINEFIWENMNDLYLWNDFIPQNLDITNEFDPDQYFNKLLFKPTDRWSFITDDYQGLINTFKGIEKTFGHNFKLFLMPGSNDVVGIVKYVIPISPADQAGIKRGDKFYKVNGTAITSSNYSELLFEKDSYTLTFGEFNADGKITQLEDKTLSALVIAENPILLHKTIDFEGDKIGYLSYNQFIRDYNDSLINVFRDFKNDNITDLVLDLRYNPGGSINTAILLSSMIAPASVVQNNEVFSRLTWNDEITQSILQDEGEESDNLISKFITPEVNLDLDKIYILITSNSASASELVINCLDPYMEVILIGSDNTTGKYVGSITINDDEGNHGWAMQPIVLKTANADGVSDYSNGFAPQYFIEDDLDAELGTLSEDMLAKSIELITGKIISEPARVASPSLPKNMQSIAYEHILGKQNMYFDTND